MQSCLQMCKSISVGAYGSKDPASGKTGFGMELLHLHSLQQNICISAEMNISAYLQVCRCIFEVNAHVVGTKRKKTFFYSRVKKNTHARTHAQLGGLVTSGSLICSSQDHSLIPTCILELSSSTVQQRSLVSGGQYCATAHRKACCIFMRRSRGRKSSTLYCKHPAWRRPLNHSSGAFT